jgi:uncharacterized protein DUF5916
MAVSLSARLLAWVLALAALDARAAEAPLQAPRTTGAIRVDGRLAEAAWRDAPRFDAFVELYPRERATPRRHTEVRFLHDDARLYVGVRCDDEPPGELIRPLGRRDRIPSGSDTVAVGLDSSLGRRDGYLFIVSAAGVMEDRLLFEDTGETEDWDAVWDAAVDVDAAGWTAEIAIPFAALRFAASDETTFGVYVERKVGATHEVFGSVTIPLGAGAFVSRFGDLALGRVSPSAHLLLTPFLATRLVLQPGDGGPRTADPIGDLGLDLTLPLSSAATLTAALAPDFGQVEADPLLLNLTRFETFFPEKRPFFQRDLDLFQPVGGASGDVPHQLLYTRRIGANAPILGAAKLTGSLARGLSVGVLDAFVAGAARDPSGAGPRFHPEQPLHLAPEATFPDAAPTPTNFAAAVVRAGSSRGSSAGLMAVLATPFADEPVTPGDAGAPHPPPCADQVARGGAAAAATFTLRSDDAAYGAVGQVSASHALGGPPVCALTDGTALHRGDDGLGAYVTAGKLGGEPLRAFLAAEVSQPTLDLTVAGFQPDSNLLALRPELRLVRAAGLGPFHEVQLGVRGALRWTTDGRGLDRGRGVRADLKLVFPGFHELTCDAGYEAAAYDVREIVGTGVAYLRPPVADGGCTYGSDRHRDLSVELGGRVTRTDAAPPLPAATGWRARAAASVRLHPRSETQLSAEVTAEPIAGRFVSGGSSLLFGDIDARSLSVTLRQLVVLTRRLTFEAYGQLFTDYGVFSAFYAADRDPATPLTPVTPADLRAAPTPTPRPDFVQASLRVNAVLRWEYRPGSALFAVYQRSSDATLTDVVPSTARLAPDLLPRGAPTDVFLLKVSVALER